MANGFEAMKMIVECQAQIPDHLLRTLLVIANHLPKSFPSKALISRIVGKSTRSIQTDIKQLEGFGFIQIERRSGRSSIYRLRNLTLFPINTQEVQTSPPKVAPEKSDCSPPRKSRLLPTQEVQTSPEQTNNKQRTNSEILVDNFDTEIHKLMSDALNKLKTRQS